MPPERPLPRKIRTERAGTRANPSCSTGPRHKQSGASEIGEASFDELLALAIKPGVKLRGEP